MKHPSTPQQIAEDLFARSTSYPGIPGHKGRSDTSREAAEAIARKAETVRGDVMENLVRALPGGLTPDEVAARLRLSVLTVRPRFTELKLSGMIEKTGEKRNNISGMRANVWRATSLAVPQIESPPLAPPINGREA